MHMDGGQYSLWAEPIRLQSNIGQVLVIVYYNTRRSIVSAECRAHSVLASFPGSHVWAEKIKSLVHTVSACSVLPGFIGIWKFP